MELKLNRFEEIKCNENVMRREQGEIHKNQRKGGNKEILTITQLISPFLPPAVKTVEKTSFVL